MKRYMLLPEDSIELLRAQDEAEAAVCVFCERTMILFPCSKIEAVSIQRSVTEDRLHPVDCLELLARDTLFDAQQAVLIPVTRQDYPDFLQALEAQCPALFENLSAATYRKKTCDQTGSHLEGHLSRIVVVTA